MNSLNAYSVYILTGVYHHPNSTASQTKHHCTDYLLMINSMTQINTQQPDKHIPYVFNKHVYLGIWDLQP